MSTPPNPTATTAADLYARLAEPFNDHFTDTRGGVRLTYITGEQVTGRLNDVQGPFGWSWDVVADGTNTEADEIWVRGRMGLKDPATGEWVYREQYGSQKIKRNRALCGWCPADGPNAGIVCNDKEYDHVQRHRDHTFIPSNELRPPLDIGYDFKGACTDAMKKCASLFGVGLYLTARTVVNGKVVPAFNPNAARAAVTTATATRALPATQERRLPPPQATKPPDPNPVKPDQAAAAVTAVLVCQRPVDRASGADGGPALDGVPICGVPLEPEPHFSDGTVWTAADLARFGRDTFNMVLCLDDYRAAVKARKPQPATATA